MSSNLAIVYPGLFIAAQHDLCSCNDRLHIYLAKIRLMNIPTINSRLVPYVAVPLSLFRYDEHGHCSRLFKNVPFHLFALRKTGCNFQRMGTLNRNTGARGTRINRLSILSGVMGDTMSGLLHSATAPLAFLSVIMCWCLDGSFPASKYFASNSAGPIQR